MITETVTIRPPAGAGMAAVATTFDDAYPSLHRSAYRVAYRLIGSREEAADIAQEACARAYARWRKVARCDSPDAWVARVAGNLAIDAWRKRQTAERFAGQIVAPRPHVEMDRVDLHRALDQLPRRQHDVVLLRFVADQSEAAVAAALGCSIGTVKAHASRGLAALRTHLMLEDDDV
jgi:RNA polymerase sigma-70 factor (sigma-E family)